MKKAEHTPAKILARLNHYRGNRNFRYFVEEPADIMRCLGGDACHWRFLMGLLRHHKSEYTCLTTMADQIGKSRVTVSNWVSRMVDQGYLIRETLVLKPHNKIHISPLGLAMIDEYMTAIREKALERCERFCEGNWHLVSKPGEKKPDTPPCEKPDAPVYENGKPHKEFLHNSGLSIDKPSTSGSDSNEPTTPDVDYQKVLDDSLEEVMDGREFMTQEDKNRVVQDVSRLKTKFPHITDHKRLVGMVVGFFERWWRTMRPAMEEKLARVTDKIYAEAAQIGATAAVTMAKANKLETLADTIHFENFTMKMKAGQLDHAEQRLALMGC